MFFGAPDGPAVSGTEDTFVTPERFLKALAKHLGYSVRKKAGK